jgi:hypothetical protein
MKLRRLVIAIVAALTAGIGLGTPAGAVSGNHAYYHPILHCGFAYPGWPTGTYECWYGNPPANVYPPASVLPPGWSIPGPYGSCPAGSFLEYTYAYGVQLCV